jgi:hypothetical protein
VLTNSMLAYLRSLDSIATCICMRGKRRQIPSQGFLCAGVREPPNQRLKLTGAAIVVLRASMFFQAAPAA